MSAPANPLQVSVFTLGGTNLLAYAKSLGLKADNTMANYAGLASRHEYNIAVKQGQELDFTLHDPGSSGVSASNLNVSLWNIAGTSYLAELRSGSLDVTVPTKEASGIASAYKIPVPVGGTQITGSFDRVIVTNGSFFDTLVSASDTAFQVTLAITFGGVAFSAPMVLKSSIKKLDRGELTMENVSLELAGTPTAPSSGTSLLYEVMLGSDYFSVAIDDGLASYSGNGVITKLGTRFNDASLIEQTGTLAIQGALALSTP